MPPAQVGKKTATQKKNFFLSFVSQRLSLQHPQQAKESDTGRHSGNGDASQVLEVESVQQVLGVRVDVDRLLLDSRDLMIDETRTQKKSRGAVNKMTTFVDLASEQDFPFN